MEVDWSSVFEALAHCERRAVLARLRAAPAALSVDELAATLSDDPDAVDRAVVRLRHVHMPKLTAASLAAVDDDSRAEATGLGRALPAWVVDPDRHVRSPSTTAVTEQALGRADADDD